VRHAAGGNVIDINGKVSPAGSSSAATAAPTATAPAGSSSAATASPGTGTGTPAPAILALREAVNVAWPKRGKKSDGIMGDAAHQARASDHNTGDALDITFDPNFGPDMSALAEVLFNDPRVKYIIWKGRIRSSELSPGVWREYCKDKPPTSCNMHTIHMHVSVKSAMRSDTRPWIVSGVAGKNTPAGPPVDEDASKAT
jgi:hypothetical protein